MEAQLVQITPIYSLSRAGNLRRGDDGFSRDEGWGEGRLLMCTDNELWSRLEKSLTGIVHCEQKSVNNELVALTQNVPFPLPSPRPAKRHLCIIQIPGAGEGVDWSNLNNRCFHSVREHYNKTLGTLPIRKHYFLGGM
ncbi:hypothetical protein Lmor_3020 [Legionella moravica]|uniref:Uncharacterized protein n=1 Tax=Legionella moravica TaxID=39962 RepID=A0A378JZP0_9GAMM|nr:hypothetical protein Lmor_3020 [Legionella moravica]STX63490.1 Uncharacterised protein [Legionella moravica]